MISKLLLKLTKDMTDEEFERFFNWWVYFLFAFVLIFVVIGVLVELSYAATWHLICTNGNCEASWGGIKLHWTMGSEGELSGKLTGVEGLPISISDFKKAEETVSMTMEKILNKSKTSTTKAKAGAEIEGSGLGADVNTSKGFSFIKKKSMHRSKTGGRETKIDYALAFVKWFGDHRYSPYEGKHFMRRYMSAAEDILDIYYADQIEDYIEAFFWWRLGKDFEKIVEKTSFLDPLTDENRIALLAKYCCAYFQKNPCDYHYAFWGVSELKELNSIYVKMREGLTIIMKPGMTARKIAKVDKDLAALKWIVDKKFKGKKVSKKELEVEYAQILAVYYQAKKDRFEIPYYVNWDEIENEMKKFDTALKKNDPLLDIVMIK